MDFILLGFLLFFCAVGVYKGFVRAVFSLLSTFLIAIISWRVCPIVAEWLSSIIAHPINSVLNDILNNLVPGTFSDVSQFQAQILQGNVVFAFILNLVLSNITFEGELTAGQILGPTLSNLFIKVLSFVVLFVLLLLIVRILRMFVNKLVKICGLNGVNRFFGGFVGLVKGLLYFVIFYMVFCAFANFTLNENMLNFVSNGSVSQAFYNWFIEKIINLFY
ncbi:MAG: CvpA family protein [Candidatus Caccovivens sp.]